MKQHIVIWSITIALLLSFACVALVRQVLFSNKDAPMLSDALVAETISLLSSDPSVLERRTQAAVRRVAVEVERGVIVSAEGAYVLALQYQRERNLTGSEALFKRAIALRPDWNWPYDGLGLLLGLHSIGRIVEAKRALEKAITLSPDWSRSHITLAVLLRLEGRLEKAEKEALIALELSPKEVAAHNNYANLLFRQERYAEAEGHYRQAIKLNPARPKPHYNLACLYSRMGRMDEAIGKLKDAIDLAVILRTEASDDPDFEPIRANPKFHELVFGDDLPAAYRREAEAENYWSPQDSGGMRGEQG